MTAIDALTLRNLVAAGDRDAAASLLAVAIESLVGESVAKVLVTSDEYSLNSVSGTAFLGGGDTCFFKFHVEEGEADGVGEYYRANVLRDAGLPVDVPLAFSTVAGQQLVLYRSRTEQRLVDVCRDIERKDGAHASLPRDLLQARRSLDEAIGKVAVQTLRLSESNEGARASLHQLFSHRMHDGEDFPGGRLARWYLSQPGWQDLARRTWTLDGVHFAESLDTIITEARRLLAPVRLGSGPVITAHGDDHNGNVWVDHGVDGVSLTLFDPAFAGTDLPSLLALVKPTFHNVFAHPDWLYHPHEIDLEELTVVTQGEATEISFVSLSPLRQEILDSMVDGAWIPLLSRMKSEGWLDPDWRTTVRSALAMCPLLVTNLLDEQRLPEVRLLGLAKVVQMGSEPTLGKDSLTKALDRIQEAVEAA